VAGGQLEGMGTLGMPSSRPARANVHVYFATETGNSKALSLTVMKALKLAGFKTKATAVNRLKPEDLKKDDFAIFLISTHGEGDPPESAMKFFKQIKDAPDQLLAGLSYGVLGLGDSSYEIYCGAAADFDKELKRLGAERFVSPALLDVDYSADATAWIDKAVAELDALNKHSDVTDVIASSDITPAVKIGRGYTRLDPVTGTVKDIVNLNDRGSLKETYHIEIAYDDAEVSYTPGDAAGIILSDPKGAKETPRLYSIASSPSFHSGEIHLTVALATYAKEDGSKGFGLASGYLSNKKEGDTITFYIGQNLVFNLPNDSQDVIMIGPGTGIAPFRSFIYERADRGASGRNWLFFGDHHAHCDFLYQSEWQEHLAMGNLDRLDLAFSRDQENKIYVQDRMIEQAKELMVWIETGAIVYLCGCKDPMSHDVEKTLIQIIAEQKAIALEDAEDYLAELEEKGRYLKDVY